MVDIGGAGRRASRRWLWIVVGVAALGVVLAVVGIWHLPARMYPDAADTEARAALQSGLLTAAAALVAVTGGLIALDETREANAEIRRANENTHVRELYTRAIDQLGSDSDTIRLGGIYALERIVSDSPTDQRTVVEVLSAFIRRAGNHKSGPVPRTVPPTGTATAAAHFGAPPAIDVRAAVQVLARLSQPADLTGADLRGLRGLAAPAVLSHLTLTSADLSGARLAAAVLHDAELDGVTLAHADLRRADLTGAVLVEANLVRTRLSEATLSRALLFGADLNGADLTGAQLDGATLTRANLAGATLTNARGLTQDQVDAARGDDRTRLPQDLTRPASWGSVPAAATDN